MAGVPPKKATAFSFTTALTLQSDTKLLKANPTLAAGDALISKDYGAFANLTTLPDAEPDAGYAVRVQLSATEMDADVVTVLLHDAAGAEWCDQLITILTDTATVGEIEAQTDDIGVAGAGLTAVPWNAAWDAEVQSEVTDGLNAYDPPTNTEMEARTLVAASYFDPAADTVAAVTLVASTTTVGATGLTAIAAAVWDRLTSALTTAGSIGALAVTKLGYLVSGGATTVQSPVAANLSVTTYMGDDYDTADSRQLSWTVSSTATLTGGTVAVVIEGLVSLVGAVTAETTITCDLTAAQTTAIPAGTYDYSVRVTQTVALGSDVLTIVRGRWTSKAALSAT